MGGTKVKKSYLDLVRECDGFPYYEDGPKDFEDYMSHFYAFKINGCVEVLGYMKTDVVKKWDWSQESWEVDHDARTLTLLSDEDASVQERTDLIQATLHAARAASAFEVLKGWRDELYPIYVPGTTDLLASMERSAACLFGILTFGIHMTAYTVKDGQIMIWVPVRSETKSTFPGMMDNSVAGGITTGETPFECMLREAMEEASLEREVAEKAIACGCLTYIYIRDKNAGGETGVVQPECEYIYDLKLEPDIILQPKDGEVGEFFLMSIPEVIEALEAGKLKPNCAVVMIDFLMRHGKITPEEEKDYIEISARIHRRLGFPLF
ncbi:hypothetical protein PABG_04836 [Paracoccidioides brasiliensis Pb03]|uniref:Nudix hydrolase domain-containing protein n=2 Tax=Paracoccidioides brasiliensis TaxID=121759 RepID=C1GDY8_PARBD|nr:uncharacterized protein PADG_05474 [Paracoccidioides brasiliensis Pb18]EEH22625.1 hypothetical protein PABG_04836 [Paracoccidioides brasiliensis Pb03]EEH49395.1 hypothetical protein PADG_05474 [Paracoccidioides brasiliensis Pb18]ODH14133.1 hypothetical protein ACO22_06675 [Paracoccidioides brasiliensis]ODH49833.1 hypothetical protein GX48_04061 [Paracoccidioides brasiliensis]